MSDPPKSAPTFSFGSTATSGAPQLFGEMSSNNTSSNMFGSSNPGTSGGLFGTTSGQPNNPSAGLFSSNTGQNNNASNAFGSNSTIGSFNTGAFGSSSAFGANTGQSNSTGSSSGLFGSNTGQKPSNTSGGSGLFGTQPTTTPGIFGSNPSTSASAQPSTGAGQIDSGLFGGNSTTSGSLFGGNSNSNAGINAGGLFGTNSTKGGTTFTGFGAVATNTPTSAIAADGPSGRQGSTTGSGLFGNTSSNTNTTQGGNATPAATKKGTLFPFGNASTTPAGPPPFGNPNQSAPPPTFNTSKPQEKKGLFSPASTSGTTPGSSQASQSGSTAPRSQETTAASFNPFGTNQEPVNSATSSIPAGSSSASSIPATSATTSLFSATISTAQTGSSLFAGQNTGSGQEKSAQTSANSSNIPSFLRQSASGPSSTPSAPASTSSAPAGSQPTWSFQSATTSGASSSTPATSATTTSTLPRPLLFQTPSSQPTSASTTSQPSTTAGLFATGSGAAPYQPLNNSNITDGPSANDPSGITNIATAGKDEEKPFQPSLVGPRPSAQSRLRNKSVDEIITRWAADLTKYQKEFQKQAEKVATWDRMLVENSDKVQKLYGSTLEAEKATVEVERQLTSVEGDQAELEYWLDHYERQIDEMMASALSHGEALQGPDQERERTYKLAENLSDRLNDMGKDLTSMIEEINDASTRLSKSSKADDTLSQIVRVLNGHLSQLQQIDQNTAALQAKVNAAQKTSRNMGSSINGANGLGSSAADDFYRSYMGRR
ncbi:MAG: FG-nucleoporin nsp1 [Icmadophila ericetorum]|nr:FG-nucleoporin nsp1 [Icmadophila ericetorum]